MTVFEEYDFGDAYDTVLADKLNFVISRCTAGFSLLCSLCVVVESYADIRCPGKGSTSVIRLLIALQIPILIQNIVFMVGTTASPRGLIDGARGSIATCTAQGFFATIGIVGMFFWDMALSLSYVLIVVYNWTDQSLWRLEKALHMVLWPTIVGLAIPPLFTEAYNNAWNICFINNFPNNCLDDGVEAECVRNAGSTAMAYYILVWMSGLLAFFVSSGCIYRMYRYVNQLEKSSARYASGAGNATSEAKKRLAIQGLLYASTFFVSSFPNLVTMTVLTATGRWSPWAELIAITLYSLNGFYFLCIFLSRRTEMNTTFGKWMRTFVFALAQCCSPCVKTLSRFIPEESKDTTPTEFSSSGIMPPQIQTGSA